MASHKLIYFPDRFKTYSFAQFVEYHSKHCKHDTMTAKERFEFIGGKVPAAKKHKEQPPDQFMQEL